MASDEAWHRQVVEFGGDMRKCGWTQPFLYFGQRFTCIGVATPWPKKPSNDNWRLS
jgi:hypothetical protein